MHAPLLSDTVPERTRVATERARQSVEDMGPAVVVPPAGRLRLIGHVIADQDTHRAEPGQALAVRRMGRLGGVDVRLDGGGDAEPVRLTNGSR